MSTSTSSVCMECAKSERKGCCYVPPGTDATLFGITMADVARVEKATGKKAGEFTVLEQADSSKREHLEGISPDLAKALNNDIQIRLKRTSKGFCSLLTPTGCSLSKSDRPRICSLFPSHYETVGNRVLVKADVLGKETNCLAFERANGSATKMFRLMGTTSSEVEKLAEKAAKEAEAHTLFSKSDLLRRFSGK